MGKVALCFKENLNSLMKKEVETIDFTMVDRDICELPENGYQQLIPYVVFRSLDAESGRLNLLQYKRPDQGDGEERLAGKVSIGFGGHIDEVEEVVYSAIVDNEDGSCTYKLNVFDIVNTAIKSATREIKEELGIDITNGDFDISTDTIMKKASFFAGELSEEVNQVHTGILVLIDCTQEQMDSIKTSSGVNAEEVQELSILGVNLDVIVEEMDINNTVVRITNQLHQHNMENWSCLVFDYILKLTIFSIFSGITYNDLYKVAMQKKAEAISEQDLEVV